MFSWDGKDMYASVSMLWMLPCFRHCLCYSRNSHVNLFHGIVSVSEFTKDHTASKDTLTCDVRQEQVAAAARGTAEFESLSASNSV